MELQDVRYETAGRITLIGVNMGKHMMSEPVQLMGGWQGCANAHMAINLPRISIYDLDGGFRGQ